MVVLHPDMVDAEGADWLLQGLAKLLLETSREAAREAAQNAAIPSAEYGEYRAKSAELAARLTLLLREKGQVPDILGLWEEAAQGDVLPEVRHAWGDAISVAAHQARSRSDGTRQP